MRRAAASSVATKNAPLGNSSRPASVGLKARTDTANEGIKYALAEQCGAGDKTDDEGETKVLALEQGEVEQASAMRQHLLAEKCQQCGCANHRWPEDAEFGEPVPPAALVKDIGEAEECK
jgi:hypothetical protein